ncbi:type II toxin-antitoxin system PemK/MazF family toxin [Bacillus sp. FJAT-49736]|uniref:type II toxin-antitoxin system PemK/MazF family toxin n=1 Tax=Bacillus sp. FJAT-49736 TaxID=2833582 RepID=UPI001BCA3005|nr:type II toxin-antitoxin system PemK/MazF family toxin [Bacillus sp. FJAT-49736]MBS4171808.1 type II toxin-antitoxin system PemK/MazF family toxin [Bacillus sp. FJAT-49736]
MSLEEKIKKILEENSEIVQLINDAADDSKLLNGLKESQIQLLLKKISSIEDDHRTLNREIVNRETLLRRVNSFIDCTLTKDRIDDQDESGNSKTPTQYIPPLVKGQIVQVKFSGVGSETDDKHLAIVWNTLYNRDQVVVIPTTSMKPKTKEREYFFNIGLVPPLYKENVVCIDQITSVSRKRIIKDAFFNGTSMESAFLDDPQLSRIEDGFRLTWLSDKSLFQYLIENNVKDIPEFSDFEAQIGHFWRPFRKMTYDKVNKISRYQLYNSNETYEIKWKQTTLTKSQRKKLIMNMAYAIDQTDEKGKIITVRLDVKKDVYNELLQSIK